MVSVTACSHLGLIEIVDLPPSIAGCEECLEDRRSLAAPTDVHELREDRLLRTPLRIATRGGMREMSHPIARSAEPGEDWSWCFVDEVAFVVASD